MTSAGPAAAPGEGLRLRDYILIALFALAFLAPGISSLPPIDRDESRYAVASSQMLQTHDFIDVRYQDQPRYLQPAGIYWLQSAAVSVFSSEEARQIWAYRMPSLICAILAVLMTGWMGGSLFSRRVGYAAALLLAACVSLNFESRNAKIDATLLATIVTAQAALMRIYLRWETDRRPRLSAALFWAAMGVGLMLKGPIILIVMITTILALSLWERNFSWLKRLHASWGIPLTLLIAVPWFIAIGVISDGAFFTRSVGKNLLGKVASGQQSHGGPPGYHLLAFTAAFWPGALFVALGVAFAWRRRNEARIRFLLSWLIPTWVVFELIATKLPHYVLPTYPALAILAGAAALQEGGWKLGAIGRWAVGVYAAFWLLIGLVLCAAGAVLMWQFQHLVEPVAVGAGVIAALCLLATLWFVIKGRPERALAAAGAAALIVYVNTFAYVAPRLDNMWLSPKIVSATAAALPNCKAPILATSPYHEASLVFLSHGRAELVESAEAAEAVAKDPACHVALIGEPETPAFLARAAALNLKLQPVTVIAGQNYSDGNDLKLTLYKAQ